MHRRDFITKASLTAAALSTTSLSAQTSSTKTMSYTLAPLPYPHAALEPHIDQATMEIHHGKHHNAYVTNVNADETWVIAAEGMHTQPTTGSPVQYGANNNVYVARVIWNRPNQALNGN